MIYRIEKNPYLLICLAVNPVNLFDCFSLVPFLTVGLLTLCATICSSESQQQQRRSVRNFVALFNPFVVRRALIITDRTVAEPRRRSSLKGPLGQGHVWLSNMKGRRLCQRPLG